MRLLNLSPILSELNPEEFARLEPYLKENYFEAGSLIIRQGDVGREFHIIWSGRVEVYLEGEPRVRVATLGPEDFFGEMSCLTEDPVSATIQVVEPAVTVSMNQAGLLYLVDNSKALRRHLISALVKRVRTSNTRVQEEHWRNSFIVQAIHKDGESRYGELQGQSEAIARVRVQLQQLSNEGAPVAIVGESGTGKRHAAARLHYNGQRRAKPFLMVSGIEFHWDNWDRQIRAATGGTLVLTKADHLTREALLRLSRSFRDTRIVLTMTNPPDLPGVKQIILPSLRERREDIPTLVREFLRRFNVQNPDTAMSSDAMRKLMIYPFLAGNIEELERVIQEAVVLASGSVIHPEHLRLGSFKVQGSRPTVGLALGGGAVRGCAHVGVLKVLEKEGIPVDLIAGTSVGSIVGALYASGVPVKEMERLISGIRWRNLVRLTCPRAAFVENSPLAHWLEKQIGKRIFEDLKIPFAAVASDAQTGEAVILRTGSVAEAIRASTAIPFMMHPVRYHGRILIDGGVVHKVPAALARSMGADLVIAVDVGIPAFATGPARNLIDSLLHAFDIMSERLVTDEMEWADIVLRPRAPVGGYSFKNAPAFYRKGEEETLLAVPQIRRRMAELAEGRV